MVGVLQWKDGGHGNELRSDNGASINFGDVGHFACNVAVQNNLALLKDIVGFEGFSQHVLQNDGAPELFKLPEDDAGIVEFRLKQGSHIDKQDMHGQFDPK
ncbi:hypothetical protein Dsin_010897 [Dipteronia sinensis]|uniref:Uncharacterized protein n=1 Tax=Dipteronia sinensis TaxID=43782 RepID=A0AAE0AUK2_9ROSI|nr:hypothetical protein Dsin_010897 [Dipteronia sinensis]